LSWETANQLGMQLPSCNWRASRITTSTQEFLFINVQVVFVMFKNPPLSVTSKQRSPKYLKENSPTNHKCYLNKLTFV